MGWSWTPNDKNYHGPTARTQKAEGRAARSLLLGCFLFINVVSTSWYRHAVCPYQLRCNVLLVVQGDPHLMSF